ncbi:MAG: serine hydrolase [Mycobacteriaceae bacterium]
MGKHRVSPIRRMRSLAAIALLAAAVLVALAARGGGTAVTASAAQPAPIAETAAIVPVGTTPAGAPAATASPEVKRCVLNQALAYATGRGEQAAIAVYDTETGTYTAAGNTDELYSSASVVKVFIATDLLLTGQMTGDTASLAYKMVTASDDDAADSLYGLVGGDSVITTIADHYGITNLGSPPADTGQWGETTITADGLVHLYAKLKADPKVWPWLSVAMSNTTQVGTDGTDQYFGIPSATQDWAVKQGWMTGLGPGSTYNSTGYVENDRYAIAILTFGSANQYGSYMSNTITQTAKYTLPGGVVGATPATCPA